GSFTFTLLATNESTPDKDEATQAEEEIGADEKIGPPIVTQGDPVTRPSPAQLLSSFSVSDGLNILFYVVFLPLIGLVLWGVLLRARTDEQMGRLRRWALQLQRLLFLVLIATIAQFIQLSTGFADVDAIRVLLLETTTGLAWLALLLLSIIGMFSL